MIKIENLIDTFYDNLNKSLWDKYYAVEECKVKWQEARTTHSRIERDKLGDELSEKLDDFHQEFLLGYNKIMNCIAEQYDRQYLTESIIDRIKKNTLAALTNYIHSWEQYIHRNRLISNLLDLISENEWVKLSCPGNFYVKGTDEEIKLNTALMFNFLLEHFSFTTEEIVQSIEAKRSDK